MLFGMSLLYGFTQSLDISSYELLKTTQVVGSAPVLLAVIMVLVGIFFKLAASPLHIWSPDVYEASPTFVVAVFSIIPKVAIFTLLLHIGHVFMVFTEVIMLFQLVTVLSLVIGNFGALWQRNAKRLMAYSSIAHTGFLLLAYFGGIQTMAFYLVIYLVMNFSAFALISQMESRYGVTSIPDYKGLGKSNLVMGVLFIIVMIALTGLPPTAGFTAKLVVFSGIWSKYLQLGDSSYLWLFVFGLFNAVISLFYYLKIPYFLFIKNAEDSASHKNKTSSLLNYLTIILVFVLLLWFFIPGSLMDRIDSINFVP